MAALGLAGLTFLSSPALGGDVVTFTKAFAPNTIGPGSVSRLTFTIVNPAAAPLSALAFTDTLPAGVTIDLVPRAVSTCGGVLTAPAGGGTITFANGTLAATGSCTVRVDVTSATPGIHMNVSGLLTSSAGTAGAATADLTVDTGRPGFTKSFSPSTVPVGSRSTLTFTIDNTANGLAANDLAFIDPLPAGIVVANPANASTDCGTAGARPPVLANPGGSVVELADPNLGTPGFPGVGASSTCTVTVDVVATGLGLLGNTTGELSLTVNGSFRSAGRASAVLEATAGGLLLIKEFTDDPVPPGQVATLELTVFNRDRSLSAVDVAFTDNLGDVGGALAGLSVVGPLPTDPCGSGSALTGTTTLALTGGNLPPGGTCTFSVALQVPAGASPGIYPNATSPVTGTVGGSPVVGNSASDDLFVFAAPVLTKTFVQNPAAAGDTVTLQFSIANTSTTSSATDIAFIDELTASTDAGGAPSGGFLPFPVAVNLPPVPSPPCGAASSLTLVGLGIDRQGLSLTGGELGPGGSCTFDVTVDLPSNFASGPYTNTTREISATVGGEPVVGAPASDTLDVVGGARLRKQFLDQAVSPGDTTTIRFTITHGANAPADATGITFTDDLGAALLGLTALGLPMNGVCGAGSQISGTSELTLTGGTLAPGASCQIDVTLQVPAAATAGLYANTTSDVDSMVSGFALTTPAASDDLLVAGLSLSKQFTDDPVIPGAQVTLRFTIANEAGAPAASSISFRDNLSDVLAGLTVDSGSVPATPCGPGSAISLLSGNTLVLLADGALGAGESCQFSVLLDVPAAASSGLYGNTTSLFNANLDGNLVSLPNASDVLAVAGDVLQLTKTFLTNPVGPGATVDLELTLTNLSAVGTATGITFTDDLGAALPGLQAVALPADGFCGAGSTISGTSVLTVTGAELGPGASCTFVATLQVPAAPSASSAVNTTSSVTATIGGLAVTGEPATDTLAIQSLAFTKSFAGPAATGGTVALTFTLDNLTANPVADLGFTDDLDAVLPGLAAVGLPLNDPCGLGSVVTGTSLLALSGASLGPNASCSFDVTVQLPGNATPSTYTNVTSVLFSGGLEVAGAASDALSVEPPPTFTKQFSPGTVGVGLASTLTFTIDNASSALAADSLDFTDNLPAGVTVASSPAASTTCVGGTLTATAGSGVVTYTGGGVAAGSSCIVQVSVTSSTLGAHVNTSGNLTSSLGDSGTASDTLTVVPPPSFSKTFSPATVAVGASSTLTFTIDNSSSTQSADSLAFTDNLPAGLVVATPANVGSTCGGTPSAAEGAGVVSLAGGTVGAGATCTVSVDVVATAAGVFVNTSGNLTSSLGDSGPATDTLTADAPPAFTKVFDPDTVSISIPVVLTFTIDNAASSQDATGLAFVDDLPTGLVVATPADATTTCAGGTIAAVEGSGRISYSGGSVPAGSSCELSVRVVAAAPGTLVNVSGLLTSSAGDSGSARAEVEVFAAIPTLSGWGLLLLMAGFAGVAVRVLRPGRD